MDLPTRKALTTALGKLSTELAAALRLPMLAPGHRIRALAERLHVEERVGDPYEVWTDLLSRRAAVLWVLKTLYVRVLEDRSLLKPRRIVDADSQELFAQLAPNLGETAYLRWVFRDLASPAGGLPELFSPQPAELAAPPDALSRKLIDFWRQRNPDTGTLTYRFDDEHFDSRLMGDLYQDLDPVVKKRYALLQTPDFVIDFILDETLTPAIAEWGVETVRLCDPACGSGHFLLAGFKRLVTGMRAQFPERPVREVVLDVLGRVVGIDLNDYACALARARLVMTALELSGEGELGDGGAFHPQVYWADALEQVERDEVGQIGLFAGGEAGEKRPRALLTRPEVRAALRPVLKRGFHVVVGNPPYITEKDRENKAYHMASIAGRRRYLSAIQGYSLGAAFTERMLELSSKDGFIGQITADSFMKREFGRPLIEQVLASRNLVKVASTAGASIPGHGTPTVLLFVRNQPPQGDIVRVVMGKRGDSGKPASPAQGKVWRSILEGHATPGFENEFVSVADVSRQTMSAHPWSIGGGGAAELKTSIETTARTPLGAKCTAVGYTIIIGEDEAFIRPAHGKERAAIPTNPIVIGEDIRNWGLSAREVVLWPFRSGDLALLESVDIVRALWPMRAGLRERIVSGSTTMTQAGRKWFDMRRLAREKLRTPLSIAFAFKATHNHFVLDRGGRVFKQTAPVIKLAANSTEEEHLVLLAQLNASVSDFWVKQTCQTTGGPGGGKTSANDYENFYERDGTKLESFPLIATSHPTLESFARHLDTLARERVADSPRLTLDDPAATASAASLRAALDARRERDLGRLFRMVGLQEELDWLCYRLYGIDPEAETRDPEATPPLRPGLRPFEVTLAQEDAERRAAVERGEEPDEQPTAWFSRHGWEPATSFEALPPAERRLAEARVERTAASRDLGLVEQPTYKRRWYKPDHEAEEREAMELWLADRVEAWAKDRKAPFTVRKAAAALQADGAVLAVGELYTGRADFDLDALIGDRIRKDAVPTNKHHVFKPEGLLKRAAWEETWRLQHEEDAGKDVKPAVPPKYDRTDYLKPDYWALRGKLDVPKERFLAFTEVPAPVGEETLYGWAGWTHKERAQQMLALDEQLESAGIPVTDRYGLLYGVWFLLPYVAWESAEAARDFRADVKSLVGDQGVTEAMLGEWAARVAVAAAGKPKAARRKKG